MGFNSQVYHFLGMRPQGKSLLHLGNKDPNIHLEEWWLGFDGMYP